MRPFLVTDRQAVKLPRLGLLALCLLYVVPGLVGRDPWRHDDAAGFGIALTMARGGAAEWLAPSIAGEPVFQDGGFPYWIGAAFIRAMPFATEHFAARTAAAAGLGLLLAMLWYATYALARRAGVQPTDPFGASASSVDFGRAIADSALLVLLATLGVIARVHQTTAEAAQLAIVAAFMLGAAAGIERPLAGGALAGLALAATVATRGMLTAGAIAACAIALPLLSRPWRLVAPRWLASTFGVGLPAALAWPLALWLAGPGGAAHVQGWLDWNASQLRGLSPQGLAYLARTLPWFLWPSWPLALWAVIRWRGRIGEPAIALPLALLVGFGGVALLTCDFGDEFLLPLALPAALLAAFGLPTIRRSVASLIDWFAVMTFSVIGVAVWAYWLALVTGFPPRMAYKASQIVPGFEPESIAIDIVLGLLASAAWVALVRWRAASRTQMLWRPVVLSASGLVLAWFLLMTLWLPAFNTRSTYREVSNEAAAVLPADYGCIGTERLGRAERASLYYFANLRFGHASQRCGWLLVQESGPLGEQRRIMPPEGYELRWKGARPRDRDHHLRLYRRL